MKVVSKFNADFEKGEYDSYNQCWLVEVIAPEGFRWVEGPTILTGAIWKGEKGSAQEVYVDLIERMECGIEIVNDVE